MPFATPPTERYPDQPWVARHAMWRHKRDFPDFRRTVLSGVDPLVTLPIHQRPWLPKDFDDEAALVKAAHADSIRRDVNTAMRGRAIVYASAISALAVFFSVIGVSAAWAERKKLQDAYLAIMGIERKSASGFVQKAIERAEEKVPGIQDKAKKAEDRLREFLNKRSDQTK